MTDKRNLSPLQIDCTTAVVLKILDGKCKMGAHERRALLALYDEIPPQGGLIFGRHVHRVIAQARQQSTPAIRHTIHRLRLHAEARIPKLVMKTYKAELRHILLG